MRRPSLVLVALLVLALPAAGLPSGLPATCADPCRVDANAFAYDPPVVTLASGTTVTWGSYDSAHVTAEDADDPCLFVMHTPSQDAPGVRFDVVDGALVATVDGASAACASARALVDGSQALEFACLLHPTMRGALVVAPP